MHFVICQRILVTRVGRKSSHANSLLRDYRKIKRVMVPSIPLIILKFSLNKKHVNSPMQDFLNLDYLLCHEWSHSN